MATITRNSTVDGLAMSSIYLWILIATISSTVRTHAMSTGDRIDDAASSSTGASAQLRLSHLPNNVNGLPSRYHETKRSWQNLQSSWGKRDDAENGLDGIGGGGGLTPDEYADLLMLLSKPYGVDFTGARIPGDDNNGDQANEDEFIGAGEKRAWNKINAAWGKRLSGGRNNNENWGKREPGWNNLKGLWGKRATWNKLQNGWGK